MQKYTDVIYYCVCLNIKEIVYKNNVLGVRDQLTFIFNSHSITNRVCYHLKRKL